MSDLHEQHPSPADLNQRVIAEFRANGGRVGGMFEGAPLVLLTTTGARTGRLRTNPAVYARDGERVLVFASAAGSPKHPAWYHNLVAHPRVTVEIGTEDGRVERFTAHAEPLRGDERDRLYEAQSARDPAFAAYQAGTSRVIPVVALHRTVQDDPARTRAIGEFLLRVHGELREDLATLLREIDDHLAAPDGRHPAPALGHRLAAHCLTTCSALHGHHTNEDRAFTDFEHRFPELTPVIARLRREHRTVAEAVRAIEHLVTGLTAPTATTDVHHLSDLRSELTTLVKDLEAHFTYEEEQLLPTLLGTAPADRRSTGDEE
jgi:deazaflavin-dependent oxidoreductase (nitroreductase family)